MANDDPAELQSDEKAIHDEEELKRQIVRKHNLPTWGEFPFIPPKNWRPNQPLRKNSKGDYIDLKGRLWRKGPTRTEGEDWEWDVQLPNSDHLNIDWGGNITHPKPKGERQGGQSHRGLGGKAKRKKHRRRRRK